MRKVRGSYRTYSIPGKTITWFLSLRWKICLRQNCSVGSCACSEGSVLGQNTLMTMMMMYVWQYSLKVCSGIPVLVQNTLMMMMMMMMMKGRQKVKPALLKEHQGAKRRNVPMRRTNIYCGRVWNLIQDYDVQSSD